MLLSKRARCFFDDFLRWERQIMEVSSYVTEVKKMFKKKKNSYDLRCVIPYLADKNLAHLKNAKEQNYCESARSILFKQFFFRSEIKCNRESVLYYVFK